MAACGHRFTVVVTEPGDVFVWGGGHFGQQGLNTREHQLLPACVGGPEIFGARMVMVAAGGFHLAGVTADGKLLTWGRGAEGQLGHGDLEDRLRPDQIGRELLSGWPVIMVACGVSHTLVLTVGGMWTCGYGQYGLLGHGDETDKMVLTQVPAEHFGRSAQIVMVAAGGMHSLAVGSEGGVWTWGCKLYLGHNIVQDRHVPTLLAGEVFDGGKAVMVAAGVAHTVVVTSKGVVWAWGSNHTGQLGIAGPEQLMIEPARMGAEDRFGGSPVRMVSCGYEHTLIVTEEGVLWSCGAGENGALGLSDINDRRVPTRVDAQHFGDAKVVSAAGGRFHSAAVTEHGSLYTWGKGQNSHDASPAGLGHDDTRTKLIPTCVAPHLLQGARVGRCHRLLPVNALAFAMGTHARLGNTAPTAAPAGGSRRSSKPPRSPTIMPPRRPTGSSIMDSDKRLKRTAPAAAVKNNGKGCAYVMMPGELVQRVVEACASWPEGQAGEIEGLVWLLGGMMKDKVSH